MGLFRKTAKSDKPRKLSAPTIGLPQPVGSENETVIGSTVVIKGELSANENLVIEGRIEGTIARHKKRLTVGENGRINADVHASSVIVLGQIVGDIHSENHVSLAKGSDVKGDIFCTSIVVENGARFRGRVDMGGLTKLAGVSKESAEAEPARNEKLRHSAAAN